MSAEKVLHTPGPWHVTGCLDLWVEPVGAPDDGAFHGIAHCGDIHWPDYETKQKEWEANARLIASAPTLTAELAKLREVCKMAHEHVSELREAFQIGALSCCDGNTGRRSNRNVEVETALRLALAKGRPG